MGQIKAFRDGNYFILIDQTSGNRFEEPAKNVKITGATQFPQKYRFFGFSGFDDLQRIDVADILDANGEAYTDEDTWVAYKNANTGNFNSGGATPQTPSDLISEDADNAIVLGEDNKLYASSGGGSAFEPAEHDLTEFQNANADPFARISDIPIPLNYSTNEITLPYKWIDDKPIYRKTKMFSGGELSNSGSIDLSGDFINVETICPNSNVFTDWTSDNGMKFSGFSAENSINYTLTTNSLQAIHPVTNTVFDLSIFDSITITLEYTKTTD